MKYYRRAPGEVLGVINRCYIDADQGRVSLCLERLGDLDEEFPDNAHIAYAEGQTRRDYLGDGGRARKAFSRAYELAVSQGLETETAWFSICNMVQLAADVEEFRKWIAIAISCKGTEQAECRTFCEVLESLDAGRLFHEYQVGVALASPEPGVSAALAGVALQVWSDPPRETELRLRMHRSHRLRELDKMAEKLREARCERFPPDERQALHLALEEMDRAIGLDEHDATLWNYRSGWCFLLDSYQESIDAADRSIELRPYRYPRPHINKAQALWASGRDDEALECAKEALRQTEGSGLPPDTLVYARNLVDAYSRGRTEPTLTERMPRARRFVELSLSTTENEFAQLSRAGVTPETVEARVVTHLATVRDNPAKGYVPMVAELLACFTAETAARTTADVLTKEQTVPEYCIVAAMYVAARASGVHRRDAARYLCLITLLLGDPKTIKQYYRQAFLAVSAAATDEMSQIESIVREELERIDPVLGRLIADQEPITDAEKRTARSNVLVRLTGPAPTAGVAGGYPLGCAIVGGAIGGLIALVGPIAAVIWAGAT